MIGASQGGDGLGPTSLSGRIALLTRFAELVAAHAEKWAMLGAEFKGLPPHWALQQWWVDGWDLSLTPTLAGAAAVTDGVRKQPRAPDGTHAAARAVRRVHAAVQHERGSRRSVPVHRNVEDLPIGIQLAAYGRDDILIRVASQLGSAHPWSSVHQVIP